MTASDTIPIHSSTNFPQRQQDTASPHGSAFLARQPLNIRPGDSGIHPSETIRPGIVYIPTSTPPFFGPVFKITGIIIRRNVCRVCQTEGAGTDYLSHNSIFLKYLTRFSNCCFECSSDVDESIWFYDPAECCKATENSADRMFRKNRCH